MEAKEIETRQLHLLESLEPDVIPRGTQAGELIEELECEYPNGGNILDLGCGTCDVVDELPSEFEYFGLDVNPNVIQLAKKRPGNTGRPVSAYVGDVRNFLQQEMGNTQLLLIENCVGILSLGLFPSILSATDLDRVFRISEVYLEPQGMLAIADVLHAEDENPELRNYFQHSILYNNWKTGWLTRYRLNHEADPDLPDGTFAVAKATLAEKDVLDWLKDPAMVNWFMQNDRALERYARHYRLSELVGTASKSGFYFYNLSYQVWESRHGMPLSGVQLIFRKAASRAKYHPWYHGMTLDEISAAKEMRGMLFESRFDSATVRAEFMRQLKRRLPDDFANEIT